MAKEYTVKFNKGGKNYEWYVFAHDEDEAARLAETQATFSNIKGKFKLLNVRIYGEPDIYLEDIKKYVSSAILDKKAKP